MVEKAESDKVDYDDGGPGLFTMIMMLVMILKQCFFCERYRGLGETERKRLEHDEDRSIFNKYIKQNNEDRSKAEIFESTSHLRISALHLSFSISAQISFSSTTKGRL